LVAARAAGRIAGETGQQNAAKSRGDGCLSSIKIERSPLIETSCCIRKAITYRRQVALTRKKALAAHGQIKISQGKPTKKLK
jgi:hypothetical protein